MQLLAQFRKLAERIRFVWNADSGYASRAAYLDGELKNMRAAIDAERVAVSSLIEIVTRQTEAVAQLRDKMERDNLGSSTLCASRSARCDSLAKQLADLRTVVSNIREESRRGPLHARSAAQLRQFVAAGEEGDS